MEEYEAEHPLINTCESSYSVHSRTGNTGGKSIRCRQQKRSVPWWFMRGYVSWELSLLLWLWIWWPLLSSELVSSSGPHNSISLTHNHCNIAIQCHRSHYNIKQLLLNGRWKENPPSAAWLQRSDPKFNPNAPQSYCTTVSATVWMRFHWHNLLNAIALGIDPPYHGDRKGFGSYAVKTFVLPTFNSCFLDSGSKHSAW